MRINFTRKRGIFNFIRLYWFFLVLLEFPMQEITYSQAIFRIFKRYFNKKNWKKFEVIYVEMRYFTLFSKKKLAMLCPKNWENFRGDRIQKSIFSKQQKSPSTSFKRRSKRYSSTKLPSLKNIKFTVFG
jgi:hypothetical protein